MTLKASQVHSIWYAERQLLVHRQACIQAIAIGWVEGALLYGRGAATWGLILLEVAEDECIQSNQH